MTSLARGRLVHDGPSTHSLCCHGAPGCGSVKLTTRLTWGVTVTTTVRQWTGLEAKTLRAALRMTIHDFAAYLGVGTRTVAKWESRGSDIAPKPQTQSILDTALAKASGDVQARFAAAVSDSLASKTRAVDADADSGRRGDADTPTSSSPPAPQRSVLLPVVVDGRQILLPLDAATLPGRGLASAMNPAPSLGDPSRLEAKPADVERAYELYLRGQGLLATNEKQRIEAATTLLDRALDIDPRFARAQAARGYAQWRRYFAGWESDPSTLEQALGDVDAALRLDPASIGAHTTLIRICWDLGWHERALEIGRATYEKNTDSLDATLAFARALNNGGMAEAALPLTRAVLQVDPTNPTALKLLIWNQLMVGDYRSALEAARLYLPTYPRDANTRWAVALAHVGSGDLDAAVRTARDAVDADPDDVTVWNLLGYLHRLGGDETAAHDAWSTGLEHVAASAGGGNRHNPRVQSWLANVEACVGHAERARARTARLIEAEPHNGYLKYRLTHVLAELGDAEAAIRTLREAIQDGFLSVQLLWHDERLGISNLVDLTEYRQVRQTLQQNVERAKNRYAPSV
jgi:tetratricopeptide (TPR) repeat protein/DNA-binding transcriptional regulator YiaG